MLFLRFLVPPNSAVVLDEKGSPVTGKIGPFNELSTLILTCDILGGLYITASSVRMSGFTPRVVRLTRLMVPWFLDHQPNADQKPRALIEKGPFGAKEKTSLRARIEMKTLL